MLKQLFIIFGIFTLFRIPIHAEFQPWTKQLLSFKYQLSEHNLSDTTIQHITQQENNFYDTVLEYILLHKSNFLASSTILEKDIFTLEKIIRSNKHTGNKYAVLRDKVLVKSYKLIQIQNKMIRKIFQVLKNDNLEKFEIKMSEILAESQVKINALNNINYKPYLKIEKTNNLINSLKHNIRDFYALIEINEDILTYFSTSDKKIYLLNKYEKYHILSPILKMNKSSFIQKINPFLKPFGLDFIKLFLILLISLIIYLIRKVLYDIIEKFFLKISFFKLYIKEIFEDIRTPIVQILLIINFEIALYIYNDFNSTNILSKFFNIIYALFFTFIFYRVINSIARVKIINIHKSNQKIKDELINITIKIINFLIIIFGILLVLYLAGVNLTAVLSGLGIGGFAVALAARESLANFFGTLSILMSNVFSQGDRISFNNKEGTVAEIGLRVTTLRTSDNALISIPNGILANSDIKNWSKRTMGRNIILNLKIKYDENSENIHNATKAMYQMLKHHPDIATEDTNYTVALNKDAKIVSKEDAFGVKRSLLVYLDNFSDSDIDIVIYCFTKTINKGEWIKIKEEIMYKIMKVLQDNSLEFTSSSKAYTKESKKIPQKQSNIF